MLVTMSGPDPESNASRSPQDLTHLDGAGRARMVDVTGKPWTKRRALARCRVELGTEVDRRGGTAWADGEVTWSELFSIARLAGIQAAKSTATLVPLCHPLTASSAEVRLSLGENCVEIEGRAEVTGPTGVEMEALTACAVAALTIVTAVTPVGPDVSIRDLGLWEKSGGRSGTWVRPP